jgi:hypothetical protein
LHGIAEFSNTGVKYRLDQVTRFLTPLGERLLAAEVPGPDLHWPGRTPAFGGQRQVPKDDPQARIAVAGRRLDVLDLPSARLASHQA